MSIIELTCPHCGAQLQVSEDAVSFICPNCESKIVLYNQASAPVVRGVPVQDTEKESRSLQKRKSPFRSIIATILVLTVICGIGLYGLKLYKADADKSIEEKTENVRSYIEKNLFVEARTQLSSFDDHRLFKESWEGRKNALQQEIDEKEEQYHHEQEQRALEAQQQQEINEQITRQNTGNPSYDMPISLEDAKKMRFYEVETIFRTHGFDNVKLTPITSIEPKKGKNLQDGEIKEILITDDGNVLKLKSKETPTLNSKVSIEIIYYDLSDLSKIPMSKSDAEGREYKYVKERFESAGFKVVLQEETQKPKIPIPAHKTGEVKDISIQFEGKEVKSFKEGYIYPKNSQVTITYYNFN